MSEQVRPNFSRSPSTSSGVTPTPVPEHIKEQRQQREELGAIWKRTSKTTNTEYMTLRLKFSKERLQELINAPVTEDNVVAVDLVAFINKNQEDNPRRPSYRIYEELS